MNSKRLKEIISKQECCFYCGRVFSSLYKPTRDHSWPKSRNGLNDSLNIVLSCAPCNLAKGNSLPTVEQAQRLLKKTNTKIETLNNQHDARIAKLRDFTTMLEDHIKGSKDTPYIPKEVKKMYWEQDAEPWHEQSSR